MSQHKLCVGIHGAAGRMGTRLIQLAIEDPDLLVGAALVRDGHARIGEDAGLVSGRQAVGVPFRSALNDDCKIDVLIDFSLPPAAVAIANRCADLKIPILIGTTGFDPAQRKSLEALAVKIPVLISPNTSRAMNILMSLVGQAARSIGPRAEIAIVERHHRTKIDAPSGTALRLAEVAREFSGSLSPADDGTAGLPAGPTIDIHALRIGDTPGEHTVIFGFLGETLELSHRAFNRDGFARGALEAAKSLARRPVGLYSMRDLIN